MPELRTTHTTCPTCGTPATIESGAEGTCSYRPFTNVEPLRELARWIITGSELPNLRAKMTLSEIADKAREKLAESESFDG